MCLSFVACGESGGSTNDTNNQGGENNGSDLEKIERGTVTTSENPLLQVLFQTLSDEGWSYTFNEDGTCSDTEYWWIEKDTEKSMTIKIATEYKWKYLIEVELDGLYARIMPMSAMYSSDVFICFATMGKEYVIPYGIGGTHTLLSELCGKWKLKTDYSEPFTTFTINEDGTCLADNIDAIWIIADRYTTADNLYIEIYNGSEHLGGIMIWGNDKIVQGVGTNFGFTQGYYEKITN